MPKSMSRRASIYKAKPMKDEMKAEMKGMKKKPPMKKK